MSYYITLSSPCVSLPSVENVWYPNQIEVSLTPPLRPSVDMPENAISDSIFPPRNLSIEMLEYYLSMHNLRNLPKLGDMYTALVAGKHIYEPMLESQISFARDNPNKPCTLSFSASLNLARKISIGTTGGYAERSKCFDLLTRILTSFEEQLKLLKDAETAKKSEAEKLKQLEKDKEVLNASLARAAEAAKATEAKHQKEHQTLKHLLSSSNASITSQSVILEKLKTELDGTKSELVKCKTAVDVEQPKSKSELNRASDIRLLAALEEYYRVTYTTRFITPKEEYEARANLDHAMKYEYSLRRNVYHSVALASDVASSSSSTI